MEIQKKKIYSNNISFGLLANKNAYSERYINNINHNGILPDKQLIDFLFKYIPALGSTNIADIGAGTGRNTVPISNFVERITAFEQSDEALSILKKGTPKNNLTISDLDITKKSFKYHDNFDAVYMTHLTQPFTDKEAEKVFQNLRNIIKNKGIIIFDALIWQGETEKKNISEKFAKNGCKSFYEKNLLELAERKGFSLIESCNYIEDGLSKAKYIDQKLWGGLTKDGKQIYPVELKWFVFRLN